METFSQTKKLVITAEGNATEVKQRSAFWEKMEFNRFGIIPMLLVIVACAGGAAASYGAGPNLVQLAMVVFSSMFHLISVLGVMPMRAVIFSAAAALFFDGLVLIA